MQLLLVRHAVPHRSTTDADPELSELGLGQAQRIPAGTAPFHIARVVSSPQRRAIQTAQPLAESLSLEVDVVDGLAEYDRDFAGYITIEEAKTALPAEFERIKAGHLPAAVDADAFRSRVLGAVADLVATADHEDTVAAFAHGGVINVVLEDILHTQRPLTFPIDYASITRILFSRSGRRTVAAVNETQHVWDLLPRNRE